MLHHAEPMVARLRRALRGGAARAALLGLGLALAGAQLLLQMHSVGHELLPSSHAACEQCVVAKHAAPPPTVVATVQPPAAAAAAHAGVILAPASRAPLSERSRGPPTLA